MSEEKSKTKMNRRLIAEALRIEQGNARSDTKKMKTRGEVRGGGKKPFKQKGGGRARQGSIRAVQWVGGGRAFGSSAANHDRKINKKARHAALQSVIEWKQAEGRVIVDELKFDAPSTKKFVELLKSKGIEGKVLFIYESGEAMENAVKSARNLPKTTCLNSAIINLKDLLDCEWVLMAPETAARLKIQG